MQTSLDVQVRELDPADTELIERWHEIVEAAETFERPWATTWGLQETIVQLRTDDKAISYVALGAFDGTALVGAGLLMRPLLDNREKVYAAIHVAPQNRRRGIGSALLNGITDRMRAEGRTTLLVEAGIPGEGRTDHPYAVFARKHGFSMANVEVHRVLELPVDAAMLEAMREEAAAFHRDYEVRTYRDHIPDEVLPSYVNALNQLALDAPTGEVDFEAEAMTPEIYREHEQKRQAQGRVKLTALALTAGGEVVAYTDLVLPRDHPDKVYQWGTLVRRDHRGHHLGAAVKVANLLALQDHDPDRRSIHTTNAETNQTMIGINDRLGFRVVEICPEFMLRL